MVMVLRGANGGGRREDGVAMKWGNWAKGNERWNVMAESFMDYINACNGL